MWWRSAFLVISHALTQGAGSQSPPNCLAPLPKFGMVTHTGSSMFVGQLQALNYVVQDLSIPTFFRPPIHVLSVEKKHQILHGDQSRGEENFIGSATTSALANFFCVTNVDARSVCGS